MLIHESIADEYITELKSLFEKVTLGDPFDKSTFQGPQVDETQLRHIQRLVDQGAKDGALVCGGTRHGEKVRAACRSPPLPTYTVSQMIWTSTNTEKGAFMQPTILLNIPLTSAAYQEEIFGPVIIVNTFTSEDEALEEANCTEFGLFSSVYTKDFSRALRVVKRLEAGAVGVNCSVPLRALDMPIGGWKQSGVGRELASHGLNLYTELKTVFLRYGKGQSLAGHWHNS